jgi:crossover junction endodeoxyribonuclease RuvC
MLILGIDPGSHKTGYGLIELQGSKLSYITSGTLKFDSKTDFLERVPTIFQEVKRVVGELSPNEVALESLILVKNPNSLMKLAQARGAILSAISEFKIKTFEYTPNHVKSAATGYGHADKTAIQKFLKMILGVDKFQSDDESDALAIAICHAINRNKTVPKRSSRGRGLAQSLAHAVRDV